MNEIIYKLIIYTLPKFKDCLFIHMSYRSLMSGLPVILINRVKRGLWFDMSVRHYVSRLRIYTPLPIVPKFGVTVIGTKAE